MIVMKAYRIYFHKMEVLQSIHRKCFFHICILVKECFLGEMYNQADMSRYKLCGHHQFVHTFEHCQKFVLNWDKLSKEKKNNKWYFKNTFKKACIDINNKLSVLPALKVPFLWSNLLKKYFIFNWDFLI